MATLLLISFLAGILTVLAPCVLPLLPVILGGGLAGTDRKRPYIIIVSLMVSLMLFTILLKASTLLIDVHPRFWDYLSGGILVFFGFTLIFPKLWTSMMVAIGFETWSQSKLQISSEKGGIWGPIGMGAALGPVFSSCSPTYSLILATILPLDVTTGLIALGAYFLGLGAILLLVTIFGRSILGRFKFFSRPDGIFRKILGVLIIVVGIFVSFGVIKQLQTWVVENGNFAPIARIEEALSDRIDPKKIRDKEKGMCQGGNCMPENATDSGVRMDTLTAPEFTGIKTWINSDALALSSLRGKVVLIDFWTYSCINCIRTQPYLNAWYDKYEKDGLVIIGVHAPEFAFEKLEKNVREAVEKAGIRYPVALDNDFLTWNAYDNRYWPAKYLIDQEGNIVYKHFGEGVYQETEDKIVELLGKSPNGVPLSRGMVEDQGVQGEEKNLIFEDSLTPRPAGTPLDRGARETKTPETYLGSDRAKNMVFSSGEFKDGKQFFTWQGNEKNQWTIDGLWLVTPEYIESIPREERPVQPMFGIRFSAKKVFLVVSLADGVSSGEFEVRPPADAFYRNEDVKKIPVTHDGIYTVFESEQFEKDKIIEIFPTPGLRFHAFTFGD